MHGDCIETDVNNKATDEQAQFQDIQMQMINLVKDIDEGKAPSRPNPTVVLTSLEIFNATAQGKQRPKKQSKKQAHKDVP